MTNTRPHQCPVAQSTTTTAAIQIASISLITRDDFRCRRSQFIVVSCYDQLPFLACYVGALDVGVDRHEELVLARDGADLVDALVEVSQQWELRDRALRSAELGRGDGQVPDPGASGPVHGVGDRSRSADYANLADTFRADRIELRVILINP